MIVVLALNGRSYEVDYSLIYESSTKIVNKLIQDLKNVFSSKDEIDLRINQQYI